MGFRFRRSIRVLPGVRLNVGKRGVTSVSVGGRGMTTNINKSGSRTTVGLPGSGISYSTKRKSSSGGSRLGIVLGSIFLAVCLLVALAH